jgi:hypothetical protein
MLQDRAQKALALRYVVARHWFPQLEVEIRPSITTASASRPITDIDVLALIPDEFEGYRSLVIDCKTKKGESPIARSVWQRGLMDIVHATRGICILKRDQMEFDHRQAAAQFGVLLLTEADFTEYVRTTAPMAASLTAHLADLGLWEDYFAIGDQYKQLTPAIEFSRSGYWSTSGSGEACRRVVYEIVRARPEFDPSKNVHLAVVGDLIALTMHAVANIVTQIFASYLKPSQRADLSTALLFFIYGGREAYGVRAKLRSLVRRSAEEELPELALPEWNQFVQLVRNCLDAPTEVSRVPLLVREVAWSFLSPSPNLAFAEALAAASPQAARLAILGVEYVCRAAKLPPEFQATFSQLLLRIQRVPN